MMTSSKPCVVILILLSVTSGQVPTTVSGCRSWLWHETEFHSYNETTSADLDCRSVEPHDGIDGVSSIMLFCRDSSAAAGTGCLCSTHEDCNGNSSTSEPSPSYCSFTSAANAMHRDSGVGFCALRKGNDEICESSDECRSERCCPGYFAASICCAIAEERPKHLSPALLGGLALAIVLAVVLVASATMLGEPSSRTEEQGNCANCYFFTTEAAKCGGCCCLWM